MDLSTLLPLSNDSGASTQNTDTVKVPTPKTPKTPKSPLKLKSRPKSCIGMSSPEIWTEGEHSMGSSLDSSPIYIPHGTSVSFDDDTNNNNHNSNNSNNNNKDDSNNNNSNNNNNNKNDNSNSNSPITSPSISSKKSNRKKRFGKMVKRRLSLNGEAR